MGRTTASSGPGELLARAWSSPLKAGYGRCGGRRLSKRMDGIQPAKHPAWRPARGKGVVSSSRCAAVRSPRSSPIAHGDERVAALYES